MKGMEKHLRPVLCPSKDLLQFAYQPHVSVDDAIICLLQKAHSALERPNTIVRITYFEFSSALNTIQPRLLRQSWRTCRWIFLWLHEGQVLQCMTTGCSWCFISLLWLASSWLSKRHVGCSSLVQLDFSGKYNKNICKEECMQVH